MTGQRGPFARRRGTARSGYEVEMSEQQWRDRLTPEQYRVLREAGTERAGSGRYAHPGTDGTYRCAGCDAPLFEAATQYDSGTGWPSFTNPVLAAAVELVRDRGLLLSRTEVRCRRCGSHLGHVFRDGPSPTGSRYCMNSAALNLTPRDADAQPPARG